MNVEQTKISASDSQARRAAQKAGMRAQKSRRMESWNQQGGYMLLDSHSN